MHRVLPRLELNIGGNGPFAAWAGDKEKIGFLLGNPEADARRAMVVHTQGKEYVVSKVGTGGKSKASVIVERGIIETLPKHLSGIPSLRGEQEEKNWASYSTDFIKGKSPGRADDAQVMALLNDWVAVADPVPLGETKQWIAVMKEANRQSATDIWAKLSDAFSVEVMSGVFHGDFAPWNIKMSREGYLNVLDWEHGSSAGPAGWDWLHYLIQRAILVDKLSAWCALDLCRKWAATKQGKHFLAKTGWGEQAELWIGTYLAYSSWIAGFDRKELITAWMGK
jgi:hypothetical protein